MSAVNDVRRLAAEQRRADLEWLMNQPQFRRVAAALIKSADEDPWTSDPHAASYNAGRHQYIRGQLKELRDVDIDQFHQIEREARGVHHG